MRGRRDGLGPILFACLLGVVAAVLAALAVALGLGLAWNVYDAVRAR